MLRKAMFHSERHRNGRNALMGCLAIAVLLTIGCARTPELIIIAEPDPLPTGWVEPLWNGGGTYLYSEVPDGYANLTLNCWLPNRPVGVLIGSGPGVRFDYRDRTAQVWLEWDGQSADGYETWEISVASDSLVPFEEAERAAFASALRQHSTLGVRVVTKSTTVSAQFDLTGANEAMDSLGVVGTTCTRT